LNRNKILKKISVMVPLSPSGERARVRGFPTHDDTLILTFLGHHPHHPRQYNQIHHKWHERNAFNETHQQVYGEQATYKRNNGSRD
jgi:hypothetical protein